MKLRGYRQHRATGEVWAVESEDNVDVGCVGPISERDADARLLDFFAYQSMGLFPYRVQDFVRLDLCPICSLAILGTAPVERLNGNMAHASCMAERPTSRTKSVGAAVMMIEPVWLRSSRLIRASRRLREVSDVLLRGRAFVLVSYPRSSPPTAEPSRDQSLGSRS